MADSLALLLEATLPVLTAQLAQTTPQLPASGEHGCGCKCVGNTQWRGIKPTSSAAIHKLCTPLWRMHCISV